MTARGREVCPEFSARFEIIPEVMARFRANPRAWENFKSFHLLYQRVRIDNIQRKKSSPELFHSRFAKLIDASERGEMIGERNDNGLLFHY